MIKHLSLKNLFKNLKKILREVILAPKSPLERALGISLGIFAGYLPLIGFQSIFLGIFALVKRVDRLSLFLGYELAKLTPFPLFLWGEYKIGVFFIDGPSLSFASFRNFDFLLFKTLLSRVLIGGFILAMGMMLLSFGVMYSLLRTKFRPT